MLIPVGVDSCASGNFQDEETFKQLSDAGYVIATGSLNERLMGTTDTATDTAMVTRSTDIKRWAILQLTLPSGDGALVEFRVAHETSRKVLIGKFQIELWETDFSFSRRGNAMTINNVNITVELTDRAPNRTGDGNKPATRRPMQISDTVADAQVVTQALLCDDPSRFASSRSQAKDIPSHKLVSCTRLRSNLPSLASSD